MKIDVVLMNNLVLSGKFKSKSSCYLYLETSDREFVGRLIAEPDCSASIYANSDGSFQLQIDLSEIHHVEIVD